MKVLLLIVCLAIGETTATRLKRSIGGEAISIGKARFFVSIKQHGYHLCGGALITGIHILTAAHCLVDKYVKAHHNLTVVSGTGHKNDKGIVREIKHLFIAPRFDLQGFRNDIAVIVLPKRVIWNRQQYSIKLPRGKLSEHETVEFIAFASTDNPSQNSRLHRITVQIRPIDFCIGYYPIGDHEYSDKICGLSDYYERPYTGDMGGPLVRHGEVVGILSSTSSSNNFASYFVDVYKFKDFINEAKKCWTSSCHSVTSTYIYYPSI